MRNQFFIIFFYCVRFSIVFVAISNSEEVDGFNGMLLDAMFNGCISENDWSNQLQERTNDDDGLCEQLVQMILTPELL